MKFLTAALVGLAVFTAQACRSSSPETVTATASAELPNPEIRYYVIADT